MNIHRNKNNAGSKPSRQQGIALVISLILLLLVTIIGVSAVKMSSIDTQVAGNSIYSTLVFQGAESALSRSVTVNDINNLIEPSTNRGTTRIVPVEYFNPVETVMGGVELNSSATVTYEAVLNAPLQDNVANDSEFKYQVFRVNAESRLNATSAKGHHIGGIAQIMPK